MGPRGVTVHAKYLPKGWIVMVVLGDILTWGIQESEREVTKSSLARFGNRAADHAGIV